MRLNPMDLLTRLIVLLTAIPVHEAAHAFVADRLGDPTARAMGRLSLNPMRHFDLLGSFCLLVAGVGWAKPVPIDPRNFRHPRSGMALSAAAGPISNLLLALLSLIASKVIFFFIGLRGVSYGLLLFFSGACQINIALAIFNLMPFPPFDGSRIYSVFLPQRIYFGVMRYERYLFLAVMVLLLLGVFDAPLQAINQLVFTGLDFLTRWLDLFFVAIH